MAKSKKIEFFNNFAKIHDFHPTKQPQKWREFSANDFIGYQVSTPRSQALFGEKKKGPFVTLVRCAHIYY